MTDPPYGQRYQCPDCRDSVMLPEHPDLVPPTVRKGCPNCRRITRHRAVGRLGGTIRRIR